MHAKLKINNFITITIYELFGKRSGEDCIDEQDIQRHCWLLKIYQKRLHFEKLTRNHSPMIGGVIFPNGKTLAGEIISVMNTFIYRFQFQVGGRSIFYSKNTFVFVFFIRRNFSLRYQCLCETEDNLFNFSRTSSSPRIIMRRFLMLLVIYSLLCQPRVSLHFCVSLTRMMYVELIKIK